MYDKNGRELERYSKDSFEYAKPRLHLGATVLLLKTISTSADHLAGFTLKYSYRSSRPDGFTDVIHPARLDAEGRGNYLPEVEDIPVPNSNVGKIEVAIDRVGFFSFGSSSESNAKPAAAASCQVIPARDTNLQHNAIKAAVEADNIPKLWVY
ncbi:MalM family protein [Vibrio chagasii]|nr:MalM family protein [Vibrio chagasii]